MGTQYPYTGASHFFDQIAVIQHSRNSFCMKFCNSDHCGIVGSSIKSMPLKHRYYSDSLNRHMQLRFETNNGHLVSVHWRQPLFRSFLCTLTIAMALSVCQGCGLKLPPRAQAGNCQLYIHDRVCLLLILLVLNSPVCHFPILAQNALLREWGKLLFANWNWIC